MTWICSSSTTRKDFGSISLQYLLMHLFLSIEDIDIASYAYNNAPYVSADSVDEVIDPFEQAANTILRWPISAVY